MKAAKLDDIDNKTSILIFLVGRQSREMHPSERHHPIMCFAPSFIASLSLCCDAQDSV